MKRFFALIGIFLGVIMLSIGFFLFAGTRGWIRLPTVDIYARPFALGTGDRLGVASDSSDQWIIGLYTVEPRPKAGIRELYVIALPIPKQINRETSYPYIIQLW